MGLCQRCSCWAAFLLLLLVPRLQAGPLPVEQRSLIVDNATGPYRTTITAGQRVIALPPEVVRRLQREAAQVLTRPPRIARLDCAVIVEDRRTKVLVLAIQHMLENLPNTTAFHVFHSAANEVLLREAFAPQLRAGGMRLTNLRRFNVTKLSKHASNWLYLSEAFWRSIEGEALLFFQVDSCLCSRSRHRLPEFLGRYDFVGGPYGSRQNSRHQNGGFSLRARSRMLLAVRLLRPLWDRDFVNEDVFFSDWAAQVGIVEPAPVRVARSFCIDSMFYDSPYAVHKVFTRFHQFAKFHKPVATLLQN
eukprot:EG_transcript_20706